MVLPKTDPRFNFDQTTTFTKQLLTQMPKWLKLPFIRSWVFWALITCGLCGGMGYVALGMLLNPKAVPNCPELFLPMSSASLRVYCGQAAAGKQTLKDLAVAFNFVKDIPQDDPLRDYIDSNIQKWSMDVLRLAELAYQQGEIDEAVSTAKLVPERVAAYKAVSKRIVHWQSTWKEAEGIYQKTENLLRNSKWIEAYQVAAKLLKLNNEYWATTKFKELEIRVQQAKDDSAKLDQAYGLIKSNNLEDLLKAITIARKIDNKSYAFKESQDLIAKSAKKMLEMAKVQLNQNNWQTVQEITRQIPSTPEIQTELKDVSTIADAQGFAKNGTVSDLERAISLVQPIQTSSTVYARAQQLLTGWQVEIQDVAYLQRAKNIAASGSPTDLEAAIREASQIPTNNPRAQEAATTIASWRRQIQVIQDQPYMQAAEQLAGAGSIQALQQAIAQLQQLPPGRALYPDAQNRIAQWTAQIQKMQDAPILESAELQARNGNISAAIATAKQIGAGRSLYNQAQAKIDEWTGDTDARQKLTGAQQLASQNTPEALLGAIEAIDSIPASSSVYNTARAAANKWGSQMFQHARQAAASDLERAIAIARAIPASSAAYNSAQKAIQQWENSANNAQNNGL